MIKRVIYIIFFICSGSAAFSQLQPLLDQYHLNGLAINPGYAGSKEALNVGLYSRNQWIGFEGAPKTFTFTMHSPMRNKRVNLGMIILDDRLGSLVQTGFIANYAYRIDMGSGNLSFGLAAGITRISTDPDAVRVTESGDPLLQNLSGVSLLPDFSFGSYYYTDKYFVGISMPLFTSHKLNEETGKFSTAFKPGTANYVLTAGYLFQLTDNFELLPTLLLKSNPTNDSQADISCSVIYREMVWVGTSIRTNGNLSTLLQLQINSQLRLGYSYGYELSELSSYQKGSHEVMLLYNFRYTLDVVNPRYF